MKNESFFKEFMDNKTLASKLIKVMIALVIIPTMLLGFVSLFQFNGIRKNNFETSVKSLNQAVESYLNDKFSTPIKVFNYIDSTNSFNGSYTSEGDILDIYKVFVETNSDIVNAFYYYSNTDKTVIYPEVELPSDLDETTREWYIKAVEKNGELAVSNVYEDVASKSKMVTISKAIIRDGQLVAILGADFDLASIVDSISKIKYGEDGIVSIVDNQGVIIAHSDKEAIGINIAEYCSDWDKINSSDSIIMNTKMDNEKYRIGVKTSEVTGFKTMLQLPSKTYNNILLVNVIILFVISIAVIWLGIYIGTKYTKGIKSKIDNVKEGSSSDHTLLR